MNEPQAPLDQVGKLAESFLARYRRGERPDLSEYTQQHPQLADQIRDLFPALMVMEELGSVEAAGSGASSGPDTGGGKVPERLGDYRILREVGRGGMGIVYEAVQESLGRHVALKVLPSHGLLATTHLERFRREARAAARLHHTNIVPVFGVGEASGVHFYAMQFIQGQGLDEVLNEVRRLRRRAPAREELTPTVRRSQVDSALSPGLAEGLLTGRLSMAVQEAVAPGVATAAGAEGSASSVGSASGTVLTGQSEAQYYRSVAQIGVQVAEALEYAHEQGILHRDIKPSNLLLDARGSVWVTDFGLAKAEGRDELTQTGDIVGTLRYMAPERFHGWSDPRSDVYGLGVTLYELLTLRPAFDDSNRMRLMEWVSQQDPPRPRKLDRHIPRDLETIVLKAIDKEPGRRYQSAADLGRDLRQFLAGEPIQARRVGLGERGLKWAKRRPAAAALLAVSVAAALALVVGTLVHNARLERYLQEARGAQRDKTRQLAEAYVQQARAKRLSGEVGQRFDSLEALAKAIDLFRALGELDHHLLELRKEAIACLSLPDVRVAKGWSLDPQWSAPLAFDPKLEHYVVADRPHGAINRGDLSVRRISDHQEVARLSGFGVQVVRAEFSADGRFLAAHYEQGKRHNYVWDLGRREVIRAVPDCGENFPGFSPDSRLVAIPQNDNSIRLYELPSGKPKGEDLRPGLALGHGGGVVFHPDSSKLAVFNRGGLVQIYAVKDGKELPRIEHPPSVGLYRLAWRGDGNVLATACTDARVYVWDLADLNQPVQVLKGHQGAVVNVTFSHGGDLLASYGWDSKTRLWNALTGKQLLGDLPNGAYRFSPDDRLLAWGSDGTKAWLSEVATGHECRTFLSHKGPYTDLLVRGDLSPNGRLMISTGEEGARLWDLAAKTEAERELARLPTGRCNSALFHPDGQSLITAAAAGLQRWPIANDPATGGLQIGPPHTLAVPGQPPMRLGGSDSGLVALCPNGKTIAVVPARGRALVFDLEKPKEHRWLTRQAFLLFPAVSGDGRWIATGTRQGVGVRIWEAATGKPVRDLPARTTAVIAFSPDNQWLAVASAELRLWKVGSWEPGPPLSLKGDCGGMAFTRDGKMLAAHQPRHGVRLFDPASNREFATLPTTGLPFCFSADGSLLVTGGDNQTLQVWDLWRIRQQLAKMDLDWDLPPYPPAPQTDSGKPLRVTVLRGDRMSSDLSRDPQVRRAIELYRQIAGWARRTLEPAASGKQKKR